MTYPYKRIAALAMGLASPAWADQLAFVRVDELNSSFDISVDQLDNAGSGRALTIRCTKRCAGFANYNEPVAGLPLGLFRLTDAYPLVLTTWGEGTSTKIRIYELRREGAKLVFSEYSLGTPTISPRGGVLSMSLLQYADEGDARRRRIIERTWTWRNGRFILARR